MTKMTATPIYGKNPLKIFWTGDLGTWYLASGMWSLPSLFNDVPKMTVTYLTSRSNLLTNAIKWDFFLKFNF